MDSDEKIIKQATSRIDFVFRGIDELRHAGYRHKEDWDGLWMKVLLGEVGFSWAYTAAVEGIEAREAGLPCPCEACRKEISNAV